AGSAAAGIVGPARAFRGNLHAAILRRADESRDRRRAAHLLDLRGRDLAPDAQDFAEEAEGLSMNDQDFERLVNSIRDGVPDPAAVRAAAERVRGQLGAASNDRCAQFRADFQAYRAGRLAEGRRMLVEDHLHSCVACRREYAGTRSAPVILIPRPFPRWAGGAVAAALVLGVMTAGAYAVAPALDRAFAPSGPRATVASIRGTLALVSETATTPLALGAALTEGQEIRTGRNSRAVIQLRDGSRVEMADRSQLAVNERWSGKTIRLERGSVMIEAAKQGRSKLEVATSDALVSVKGTIFGVMRGLKGSRVSVVQGEVSVNHRGESRRLRRGEQIATEQSMTLSTVGADIAWSQNAAHYLAMLGDLAAIQKQIDQIPPPGLRYTSRLLDHVPVGSVVVASIPNLSQTLAQAGQIFEDRARQSASFAEWWNGTRAQTLRQILDRVHAVSSYLGDEIVVAVRPKSTPIVLAEV